MVLVFFLFPLAPRARLAACLSLFVGKKGISRDGGIFCTPEYPATRKLTLPLTTLGFLLLLLLLPDDDFLLPDLLFRLFADGMEAAPPDDDEMSWARSLVSNLNSGFLFRDM